MQIVHIVCSFPPYKSGMGKVAFSQVEGLAKLGHEVTVFTPYSRDVINCAPTLSENFKLVKLKPFLKFGNAAFLPQLFLKLKKFDVVNLHYPFFGAQELIWLAKKLGMIKGKLVIFYHMDFVPKNLFLKILSLPSKLIYNSLLKMADKILVSTLDYAGELQLKHYFKQHKSKFEELPFGVDTTRIDANKNTKKRESDEKIVLFVGALDKAHYFKGVDILLKAFKSLCQMSNVKCQMFVVGDGDMRSSYEKLACELDVTDKVKFLGKVSDEELDEVYEQCDVLVLPSINSGEAFGLVLLEAMAHAKPVVASNLPGVRTVCQNNINGFLVKPGDAQDLAEKIEMVLSDDKLAQEMGERGLEMVQEKYNWQEHTKRLDNIYRAI